MGTMATKMTGKNGFTILEVLLSIIIVVITATAYLMWQKTSWSQTKLANRRMAVSQVMEKQIEWRRMDIAQDPATKFAAFKALTDFTIVDVTTKPNISVAWKIYNDLQAPNGDAVANAVRVRLTASWGSGKSDTLRLWTNITKNF
jgi:prepilin-type N-terminal cleavage/methylation domain-containing protein